MKHILLLLFVAFAWALVIVSDYRDDMIVNPTEYGKYDGQYMKTDYFSVDKLGSWTPSPGVSDVKWISPGSLEIKLREGHYSEPLLSSVGTLTEEYDYGVYKATVTSINPSFITIQTRKIIETEPGGEKSEKSENVNVFIVLMDKNMPIYQIKSNQL